MQAHGTNNLTCRVVAIIAVATSVFVGFAAPTRAATETVVHSFANNSSDGNTPAANLINVNGTLYGTTSAGGANGHGTVFAVTPRTGVERVVYSFCSQSRCSDGAQPLASLIAVGGILYGTTELGGAQNSSCSHGCGTIFSINPKTSAETVIYAFQGPNVINPISGYGDGANPMGGLLNVNGTLYGTTYSGGDVTTTSCSGGCGTIYSFVLKTHAETPLWEFEGFDNGDGSHPMGNLIRLHVTGQGYEFFGTTYDGGANGFGTVFEYDSVNLEQDFYDFAGGSSGDGANPMAGLLFVSGTGGGLMYGTTFSGGTGDNGIGDTGTVFSIDPSQDYTLIYSFCSQAMCADGANPEGGLIKSGYGAKAALFGTTTFGGPSNGDGTVFSVNPAASTETVLYSFCTTSCTDGDEPAAGLINSAGTMYGTTQFGGTDQDGTIFAIKNP